MRSMLKKDFWYDLPKELIAQEPADFHLLVNRVAVILCRLKIGNKLRLKFSLIGTA